MKTVTIFALAFGTLGSVAPSLASAETLTFLGPRGTYSDEAATLAAKPDHWDTATGDSITHVAATVADGETAYGLLPIENSSGGYVKETMGLLSSKTPGWRIVGEVTIPIDNTLLAKPGVKAEDIKVIYSHPQPFLQSAGYLKAHYPNVEQVETKSTAAAAEAVAKRQDEDAAAISAPAAASVYGLAPLAEKIQDDSRNATRFWVVAKTLPDASMPIDHIVVLHTAHAGSTSLADLLDKLETASMKVEGIASAPTGELGASRYLIGLKSAAPEALSKIETAMEKDEATTLLGAYAGGDAR